MKKLAMAAVGASVAALALGGTVAAQASDANPSNAARPAAKSVIAPHALAGGKGFAVLDADGSFVRGKNVSSVSKIGTGIYDVRFLGNISHCGWTGTTGFGEFSGSLPNGSGISVTGRAGTTNGVFVQTYVLGTSSDLPFTVLITC